MSIALLLKMQTYIQGGISGENTILYGTIIVPSCVIRTYRIVEVQLNSTRVHTLLYDALLLCSLHISQDSQTGSSPTVSLLVEQLR